MLIILSFLFFFDGISVVNVKSLQNSSSKPRDNPTNTQHNRIQNPKVQKTDDTDGKKVHQQTKTKPTYFSTFLTHRHNPLLWFYKSLLFLVLLPVLVLVVIENMDCWSPLTMDDEFEKLVI
jgi:hypothetical protein